MAGTTVAIVDDDSLARAALRMMLEAEPDLTVVGEGNDGEAALALVRRLCPDVLVMDIRMPHVDGVEATARLVAEGHDTRVLILTLWNLDEYVFNALRAGASGFLLKDAPADEIVRAVRTLGAGEAVLDPAVTRHIIQEFVRFPQHPAPVEQGPLAVLTVREREVLLHMARGLSNAEIAATLFVGESTVKTHVNHLLGKLALRDRVHAVILAYEAGLVRPPAGGPS